MQYHFVLVFVSCKVGRLHSMGYFVEWKRVQGNGTQHFVRTPSYPWQHQDYWHTAGNIPKEVSPLEAYQDSSPLRTHPLLGK